MTIQKTPVNSNKAIPLALVKEHLRVIGDDEDSTLNLYIDTATEIFEEFAKTSLINKTIVQRFDQFPCEDYFLLEMGRPLVTFTSIQYYNKSNVLTTLDSSKYIVSAHNVPPTISLIPNQSSWVTDLHESRLQAVEVRYTSGFGTTYGDVPSDIKNILLLLIGDLYANKEDTVIMSGIGSLTVSWHATKLMQKYKSYYYEHRSQSRKCI